MQSDANVLLIAVNYNSASATANLIADVGRQNLGACKVSILIADNGPTLSDLDKVRVQYKDSPLVRFERMPKNLGYFGAAYHVMSHLKTDCLPKWIIVSNADIRLSQNDFIQNLCRLSSDYGVVAPRIISAQDGLDQNPFYRQRPRKLKMYLNSIIPRVWLLYRLRELQYAAKRRLRGWMLLRANTPPRIPMCAEIYAPHGAFVIFSREYFLRGGDLNVGAFLYAEEEYVAETCLRLNLKVLYEPNLEVCHNEHISTGNNPAVRRFQLEAAKYLYRAFFMPQTDRRKSGTT